MIKRLCLLLLTCFVVLQLPATDFRFTNIGVLQGLSSAGVNCSFTDSRGFIWIGTGTGLNRFDGESFLLYAPRRNDPSSLPGENVKCITEDASGMLWIGTDRGIAKFNPWNGKAETIRQLHGNGIDLTACTAVLIDHQQQIWAHSIGGIWKFDKTKNAFVPELLCDGKENRPARCAAIYEDSKHRFWICTDDGLYEYNIVSKKLVHSQIEGRSDLVMNIFEDHAGQLWCATWGKGIAAFYPDEKRFDCNRWIKNPENPSATNIALSFAETRDGNHYQLWAATNYGLALIEQNVAGFTLSFTQHDAANPESILTNGLVAVSENNGQLWVATNAGISILLPERQIFQDYAQGFKGQTTHIVRDTDGGNFFATWYGNGLEKIDANGNIVRAWKTVPETNKDLNCGQVSDVTRGKDGSLWVATFGGLAHGDADGNNFKQVLPESGNENSICDQHITCVATDNDGFIWCGSYGKGVSRLNPSDNSCVNFKAKQDDTKSLAYDLVWSIMCTRKGKVWIGTDDGLSEYDPAKKSFNTWKYIVREKDTLPLHICMTLFEDKIGNTWIGTNNGLFRCAPDHSFHAYFKENGLADNRICGIKEDDYGNIWISTVNGLSRLDPATGIFTNFSLGNGLPVSSLEGDLGKTSGDKMLIGLNDRIIVFEPKQLRLNSSGAVFITGIDVSGAAFSFENNPSSLQGIEFPWNHNVISFDFVAPGFRGSSLVKYEFQLEGADKKWVNSDTRHFASYVGLPAGTYTFRCRASVNNGAWSQPSEFSFVIHPPVWKRWWFMLTAAIIALTLIILIVRREATRKFREKLLVLEKQQAVEQERNRISRDMHDDLGSGLTKIAILSEVVKKKINPSGDSQQQINTISESARGLVDNLNEIIWALNPENDNLSNLAAYIREYANRFLEPFGIDALCTIPDELPALHLSEEKRRNIFLVVKEALHNIVKHSGAKNVQLIFKQNGSFSIEIKDDGKGFAKEDVRAFGNGLKSMKKRTEAIGATFSMTSEQGNGASVKIELPV